MDQVLTARERQRAPLAFRHMLRLTNKQLVRNDHHCYIIKKAFLRVGGL